MKTIADYTAAYARGETKPSAAIASLLERIRVANEDIHAYIDIFDDAAKGAEAADAAYARGETKPLLGVPVAIKNNILIAGRRATAGSKMLEHYTAAYDATAVARLRDAGAVFVGSTNMDEFAMGSSSEHSAFGPVKNPVDHSRVPGGSSGGSAAAVALGDAAVPAALGTDTGGSIRQPASFCGVVGLKPTYGAVSRSGLIAMGSSLDQAGPLTNTVADAQRVFDVISGVDSYDSTSYPEGTYPDVSAREHYRIGVPRNLLAEGLDDGVRTAFEESLEQLASAGHEIVDISLPLCAQGLAAYYIVMPAEVSSNLARYDGVRYGLHVSGEDLRGDYTATRAAGFGPEVRRRILIGTYVLSHGYYDQYYSTAEGVRRGMRRELSETFASVDVIATPTTPTSAFALGEKQDPLSMYLSDVFTVPANLTGVPALSVPTPAAQADGQTLPIGIQFMAPHAGEARLFDIGGRFRGES